MNADGWCPAGHEVPAGATWRCNLLPGHVGPHDDGIGDTWGDAGPSRLQVAANCLIGSQAAWAKLRPELEAALGLHGASKAIAVLHDALIEWRGTR